MISIEFSHIDPVDFRAVYRYLLPDGEGGEYSQGYGYALDVLRKKKRLFGDSPLIRFLLNPMSNPSRLKCEEDKQEARQILERICRAPKYENEPSEMDIATALCLDASYYESAPDLADFLCEFGYSDSPESIRKGQKVHIVCAEAVRVRDKYSLIDLADKEELGIDN